MTEIRTYMLSGVDKKIMEDYLQDKELSEKWGVCSLYNIGGHRLTYINNKDGLVLTCGQGTALDLIKKHIESNNSLELHFKKN